MQGRRKCLGDRTASYIRDHDVGIQCNTGNTSLLVLLGQFDPWLIGQFENSGRQPTPMPVIPQLLPDPPDLTMAAEAE